MQSPQHSDSPAAKRPGAAAHWPQGLRLAGDGRVGMHSLHPAAGFPPPDWPRWWQACCCQRAVQIGWVVAFRHAKGIVGPWCLASAVRGGGGMQYWFGVTKAGGWRGRGMAVALDATTGPDITLLLPRRCRSLLPLAFISSNCTPRKTVLDSTSSPGFHPLNIAVDNSVTPKPRPLQGYTRPTPRLKTTAGRAHDQGKTKATAII